MKNISNSLSYLSFTSLALTLTAVSEWLMGRVFYCTCGYIKFWHGITQSSENSQHLTDWYTFSHIIHGFGFYYLGKFFLKNLTLLQTFVVALGIEVGWEILENTSLVINRYRDGTISLNYFGDSIINSLFDVLAMVGGFYLAKRLPLWLILVLTIGMEVFVGYMIRDNLTLNIIMLLYPFKFIKAWQLNLP